VTRGQMAESNVREATGKKSKKENAVDVEVRHSAAVRRTSRRPVVAAPTFLTLTRCAPQNVLGIILGGGAGTRLYPLTKKRAKPAVPLVRASKHQECTRLPVVLYLRPLRPLPPRCLLLRQRHRLRLGRASGDARERKGRKGRNMHVGVSLTLPAAFPAGLQLPAD